MPNLNSFNYNQSVPNANVISGAPPVDPLSFLNNNREIMIYLAKKKQEEEEERARLHQLMKNSNSLNYDESVPNANMVSGAPPVDPLGFLDNNPEMMISFAKKKQRDDLAASMPNLNGFNYDESVPNANMVPGAPVDPLGWLNNLPEMGVYLAKKKQEEEEERARLQQASGNPIIANAFALSQQPHRTQDPVSQRTSDMLGILPANPDPYGLGLEEKKAMQLKNMQSKFALDQDIKAAEPIAIPKRTPQEVLAGAKGKGLGEDIVKTNKGGFDFNKTIGDIFSGFTESMSNYNEKTGESGAMNTLLRALLTSSDPEMGKVFNDIVAGKKLAAQGKIKHKYDAALQRLVNEGRVDIADINAATKVILEDAKLKSKMTELGYKHDRLDASQAKRFEQSLQEIATRANIDIAKATTADKRNLRNIYIRDNNKIDVELLKSGAAIDKIDVQDFVQAAEQGKDFKYVIENSNLKNKEKASIMIEVNQQIEEKGLSKGTFNSREEVIARAGELGLKAGDTVTIAGQDYIL